MEKLTYEDDFMVKNHGPIATTNEHERVFDGFRLWEESLLLHHSCKIRITLTNVMLTGSQMAVEETDRRVVDDHSGYDGSLHTWLDTLGLENE